MDAEFHSNQSFVQLSLHLVTFILSHTFMLFFSSKYFIEL